MPYTHLIRGLLSITVYVDVMSVSAAVNWCLPQVDLSP